jgi:hypothetical protein
MNDLPPVLRPALRRLSRRLAFGLFLDVWPPWAAAALVGAGIAAIVCRLLFAQAAGWLPWLWIAPLAAVIPAVVLCVMRAYRPAQVAALADALTGGQGLILTLAERNDPAWSQSPLLDRVASMRLPRLRPWRRLALLLPGIVFLAVALALPQRIRAGDTRSLADHIAGDLAATVAVLKQQSLVTPEEEQKLQDEIERIREGAQERVDAASWEAADALREQLAAGLSEKQDAVKWAQDSLARYAAAAQAGGTSASGREAGAPGGAELKDALRKLAASGLLANAPAELLAMAEGRTALPTDPAALARLAGSLAKVLGDRNAQLGALGQLAQAGGKFDPSEFPLEFNLDAQDGDGEPGRGGRNRGRADAPLLWGKETQPHDRFKAQTLPPGYVRGPDDFAPIVELPGAPKEAPTLSAAAAARAYADGAGQGAWRRTLAPRHQRAVRKYFEK